MSIPGVPQYGVFIFERLPRLELPEVT